MAAVVDQADLLFSAISARFHPVRDFLVVVGLFYTTKTLVKLGLDLWTGVRVFGLSRLWSPDFKRKYGQWAVVTGCTRGIGRVYVDELAKRGMDIILVGRSLNVLQRLAKEVESAHGVKTDIAVADLSSAEANVLSNVRKCLTGKDVGVLVNCVGVIPEYPMFLSETSEKMLWDLVIVNVAATTMMTRLVLPAMESQGRGAIINLASSAALHPLPLQAVYSATKAYVDYMSEALSVEVASKGITVQTIDPSYVCTSMTDFSDWINKPSLMVPSPETFVRGAIQTLGVTHRTTGYWAHSLQNYFSSFVPSSLYMYGSFLLNSGFRREYLNKKKN